MASTKLNVDTRGPIIVSTTTSDLQELVYFDTTPNKAYQVLVTGTYRRFNGGSIEIAAYIRRAAFYTDSSGTLTQESTTQTIGTDIETTGGAQFLLTTSGTKIVVNGAAEGSPVRWAINAEINVVDNVPQV